MYIGGMKGALKMRNPQANEVWETLSGRAVLIVEITDPFTWLSSEEKEEWYKTKHLGFVWYDEVDGSFCVSQVLAQLKGIHPTVRGFDFIAAAMKKNDYKQTTPPIGRGFLFR
jgi:hypothetical protein